MTSRDKYFPGSFSKETRIIKCLEYYITESLKEVDVFSNIIYIDCRKPVRENFSDFINSGSMPLSLFKIQADCRLNSNIIEVEFILPDYITLETWLANGKYFSTKKKILKTKEVFYIEIICMHINRSVLEILDKVIPKTIPTLYGQLSNGQTYTGKYLTTYSKEDMPYPIVLYPFDSFIGFKPDLDSRDIYFCTCFKDSISNYLEMLYHAILYKTPYIGPSPKDSFPCEFVDNFKFDKDYNIINENGILAGKLNIELFDFKENICHECLKRVPKTTNGGGTVFNRTFRRYIEKRHYSYGINLQQNIILYEKCPDKIKIFYKEQSELNANDYEKQRKRIRDEIENDVRRSFGYRKIGEEWVVETTVFYEFKNAFPHLDVIHHGKPHWLGFQHFDVWIPAIKVAVEYQGIQHDEPVALFGGEEGLQKTQERDKRKLELCKEHGVTLFYLYSSYEVKEIIRKIKADILSNNNYLNRK